MPIVFRRGRASYAASWRLDCFCSKICSSKSTRSLSFTLSSFAPCPYWSTLVFCCWVIPVRVYLSFPYLIFCILAVLIFSLMMCCSLFEFYKSSWLGWRCFTTVIGFNHLCDSPWAPAYISKTFDNSTELDDDLVWRSSYSSTPLHTLPPKSRNERLAGSQISTLLQCLL